MEDQQRDQTRVELCRLNGVQLAVIDPFEEPAKQMDGVLRVLSRTSRLLAQGKEGKKRKQLNMDVLGKAHQQATRLHSRLTKKPEQTLATLAEGWRDRETGLAATLQQTSQLDQAAPSAAALETVSILSSGQRVVHSHFGNGVVTAISGEGNDRQITVLFDADRERTFLMTRVADKMHPINEHP